MQKRAILMQIFIAVLDCGFFGFVALFWVGFFFLLGLNLNFFLNAFHKLYEALWLCDWYQICAIGGFVLVFFDGLLT